MISRLSRTLVNRKSFAARHAMLVKAMRDRGFVFGPSLLFLLADPYSC